MDPSLREVLEALEDDSPLVAQDDIGNADPEDMFAELVKGGEIQPNETEDGYDSDDTVRGQERDITHSEYLAEMAHYKTAHKGEDDADSLAGGDTGSQFSTTSISNTHRTSKQRRRRRQRLGGAYSEGSTNFSMTSSANYRNEGLTTLDDRFDKACSSRRNLILDLGGV